MRFAIRDMDIMQRHVTAEAPRDNDRVRPETEVAKAGLPALGGGRLNHLPVGIEQFYRDIQRRAALVVHRYGGGAEGRCSRCEARGKNDGEADGEAADYSSFLRSLKQLSTTPFT